MIALHKYTAWLGINMKEKEKVFKVNNNVDLIKIFLDGQ